MRLEYKYKQFSQNNQINYFGDKLNLITFGLSNQIFNMIRKFYEIEAPVATGGGVNIAALMATQGVMNNTDNPVATPVVITEKKEEPTQTNEQSPAATANDAPKVEPANSEPPSPEVKTEPVVEQQKAAPPVPEKSWQEVLKSQQPDSVLKELGFDGKLVNLVKDLDPKVIAFIEAYKEGKHTDYLKEWTTDYKTMTSEDVMRHQLRQEYPTASEAALNALFKKEVTKAYNLDSDDTEEKEEGQLLLDAKADRYRAEMIKNQDSKLLPKASEAQAPQPDPQEALREEAIKNVTAQFNDSAYTKNITATNSWSVGEGEDKFNFPIDSKSIIDLAINGDASGETLFKKEVDASGNVKYIPDVEKQFLVAVVQKHGMDVIKALEVHFKARGGKAAIEPIENASEQRQDNSSKSEAQPTSAAAAMAKSGQITSGGYQR